MAGTGEDMNLIKVSDCNDNFIKNLLGVRQVPNILEHIGDNAFSYFVCNKVVLNLHMVV